MKQTLPKTSLLHVSSDRYYRNQCRRPRAVMLPIQDESRRGLAPHRYGYGTALTPPPTPLVHAPWVHVCRSDGMSTDRSGECWGCWSKRDMFKYGLACSHAFVLAPARRKLCKPEQALQHRPVIRPLRGEYQLDSERGV